MIHLRTILTVLLLMSACPLLAQKQCDALKFDKDSSGNLDKAELTAFYLNFSKENSLSTVLKDGVILNNKIDPEVDLLISNLVDRKLLASSTTPVPVDVIKDYCKCFMNPTGTNFLEDANILIRASDEDISVVSSAQSSSDADAALFSVNRNYLKKKTGFAIKGAIVKTFGLTDSKTFADAIVVSVLSNRVKDTDDSTNNANALTFRVGYSALLKTGKKVDGVFIKPSLSYTTDYQFNSKVYAVSLDAYMISLVAGIGSKRLVGIKKFRPIVYRFNVVLHGEYGVCTDKGQSEKLVEHDPFLRLGPKGTLSLSPSFLRRLDITTTYTVLAGITGSPHRFENFSEKISYAFDAKKKFSLSAEYNKGKVPLKLDEVENLLIGLSVKL